MKIVFHPNAWEDYLYWQQENRKILKKTNNLIKEIQRNPYEGLGKPESLKFDFAGLWSRRIDQEHRLVYRIQECEDVEELHLFGARYHY